MIVRRLRTGEAAPLRDLRLRSLREAPDAFATTHAQASAWPPEHWEQWAAAPEEEQVTVLAIDGERWVGMASGWLVEDKPASAWLARLWVDPAHRRTGVAFELVDAVAEWARERGKATLELSVTANNVTASAFYERAGFAPTGRRRPLPADPSRTEVFLARRL